MPIADSLKEFSKHLRPAEKKSEGTYGINSHLHLPPNFSAFHSIEQLLDLSLKENVKVLGTSNYYNFKVYEKFINLAWEKRIFPLLGYETIIYHPLYANQNILVNDPKNPGKIYLCGKALTRFLNPDPVSATHLKQICLNDEERAKKMIKNINHIMEMKKIPITLDYDRLAQNLATRYQTPQETIVLQERHLAAGLQEALVHDAQGQISQSCKILFGIEEEKPWQDKVFLQNEIRTHFFKIGKAAYVEETFISLENALELTEHLGGLPVYPILGDGAPVMSEFEKSPEQLAQFLKSMNIWGVEFIPIRNSRKMLRTYVEALHSAGFFVTAGTEHNTLTLDPIRPLVEGKYSIDPDLVNIFFQGTSVLIAHQIEVAQDRPGLSRFDQIGEFKELGARYLK